MLESVGYFRDQLGRFREYMNCFREFGVSLSLECLAFGSANASINPWGNNLPYDDSFFAFIQLLIWIRLTLRSF